MYIYWGLVFLFSWGTSSLSRSNSDINEFIQGEKKQEVGGQSELGGYFSRGARRGARRGERRVVEEKEREELRRRG